MDFILDLLQAAGIAAAIGIRPLLPALLSGALAAADIGLDFDNTDYSFLEQWPFLLAVLVVVGALSVLARRAGPQAEERGPLALGLIAAGAAIAVLEGAGSMADRGHPLWTGYVVGAACFTLAAVVVRSLFGRVRRRLDADTAAYLPLYGEGAALATCGLSILFPPLAVLVIGGLVWLLIAGRRREGEKYAGLRILR